MASSPMMVEKNREKFVECGCHYVAFWQGELLVILNYASYLQNSLELLDVASIYVPMTWECITATFHHHLKQLTSSCPMTNFCQKFRVNSCFPHFSGLPMTYKLNMHLCPIISFLICSWFSLLFSFCAPAPFSWLNNFFSYHPSKFRFLPSGYLHLLSPVIPVLGITDVNLSMFTVLPLHTF